MISRRITYLRAFCCEFHAVAPSSFWNATDYDLAQAFNGIGAEHWPNWLRAMLTALLRPFQAAALVHDWEYSQKAKSYRMFSAANWHLGVNVAREALYDCRPVVIPAGALAAFLCQVFGWRAYKNGRTSPPLNQSAALRADAKSVPNSAMFQNDSRENMQ